MLALITVLTIGVIYALTWVFRPIRLLFDCCTRHTQAVAREVSDLLPELQATHTYESLAIRGPGSRESVDDDFLQKGVKGRGTERKPNDVALLLNGQAARVKPDCDHWARVDRNGPALPSGNKSAYPARKRLLQSEASRSVEHAPKDSKSGKPICWDAATHMGCSRGSKCQHAHEPLPGLGKLDYTVAMQVIRRGGLKGGPKVDPKEVDGRVAQLRAQAAAEKARKCSQPQKLKERENQNPKLRPAG